MSFQGHADFLAAQQAKKSAEWDRRMAEEAYNSRMEQERRERDEAEARRRKASYEAGAIKTTASPVWPSAPAPLTSSPFPVPEIGRPRSKPRRRSASRHGDNIDPFTGMPRTEPGEIILLGFALAAVAGVVALILGVLSIPFGLAQLVGYRLSIGALADGTRWIVALAAGLVAVASFIGAAIAMPASRKAWVSIALGLTLLTVLVPGWDRLALAAYVVVMLGITGMIASFKFGVSQKERVLQVYLVVLAITVAGPVAAGLASGMARRDAPSVPAAVKAVHEIARVPKGLAGEIRTDVREILTPRASSRSMAAGRLAMHGLAALLVVAFAGLCLGFTFAVPQALWNAERSLLEWIALVIGGAGGLLLL